MCSCHLTSVCLCSCNEYLPSFHISFCQWQSLRCTTLYVQVLFATAFYQSPSRLTQSVMTQMAKLKIVRKEGWQVPWVASLQSLCAKDTSQRLRSSYDRLRKELLGIRNSRVLPNWRRAENWGTLYIAFPHWSTKIFTSNLFYNSHHRRIQRYLQGVVHVWALAPAVFWNLYRVCRSYS